MIAKLYLYFGVIGMASLLAWIVSLGMLINYAWHDRRSEFYVRAFFLAVLGVILASANSCFVNKIQIDWTEENKQALQKQTELRESEMKRLKDRAADVHFAEDDAYDNLDLAGVKNADQLSKYERAAKGIQATPAYKKAGRQNRVINNDSTPGEVPEVERASDEEDRTRAEVKKNVKLLPPAERQQAIRLDVLNLAASRASLLIVMFCLGLDYLRRQSKTFGNVFPLPISGRTIDSWFPKKHSCAILSGQSDIIRQYLINTVRKGETFIYLGNADPISENTLSQLHIPFRSIWDRALKLILPRSVLNVCLSGLVRVGKRVRFPASIQTVMDKLRERMTKVFYEGCLDLWPMQKIIYTEESPPFSREFVFESTWFGESCFVFVGHKLSLTIIYALQKFLDFRYHPRAVARKTVHVVWDFTDPVPGRIFHDLITLVKEANFRLLICAPQNQLAELGGIVEEISPHMIPPRGIPSCLTLVLRGISSVLLPVLSNVRAKAETMRQLRLRKARMRAEAARPVQEEKPGAAPETGDEAPGEQQPVVVPKQKILSMPKTEAAAPQKVKVRVKPKEVTSMPGAEEKPLPRVPVIVDVNEARETFKFLCPYCQQKLSAAFDFQGMKMPCPKCKREISLPCLP